METGGWGLWWSHNYPSLQILPPHVLQHSSGKCAPACILCRSESLQETFTCSIMGNYTDCSVLICSGVVFPEAARESYRRKQQWRCITGAEAFSICARQNDLGALLKISCNSGDFVDTVGWWTVCCAAWGGGWISSSSYRKYLWRSYSALIKILTSI